VRARVILCDFAQVADGKLSILGGGWTVKGQNAPMGVGVIIEVPWNEANRPHNWQLRLEDGDGQPFLMTAPEGPRPIEIAGPFEVGRPAGLIEGSGLNVCLAVNIAPLPLPPRQRFMWKLWIDGRPNEEWTAAFTTPPGD
jgi:hypothetical protein